MNGPLKPGSPAPTTSMTQGASKPELATPAQPGGQAAVAGAVSPGAESAPAAPVPAEQAPKKSDDDLSTRFAALSRKERKLLETEKAIKEREAKFGPIAEALEKKDVLSLLNLGALTMDDVLQAALKQGEKPSAEDRVQTLEEKIAALQKEKEDARIAAEEAEKQKRYRDEVEAFQKTLNEQLQASSEQYEFIHALGAQDQVFAAIEQIVTTDPDSYPERSDVEALIPQVAALIEEQLLEQARKIGQAKKFKALLEASGAVEPEAKGPKESTSYSHSPVPAKETAKPETTLTNKRAAVPAQAPTPTRKLTAEESKARAAQTLQRLLNEKRAAPTA